MHRPVSFIIGFTAAMLYIFLASVDAHAASSDAAVSVPAAKFLPLNAGPTKSGKIYRLPNAAKAKFAPYPLSQKHNLEIYAPGKKSAVAKPDIATTVTAVNASQTILTLFDEDPAITVSE